MKAYFRPNATVVVRLEEGDNIAKGEAVVVDLNGLVKRPVHTHEVPARISVIVRAMPLGSALMSSSNGKTTR